MTGREFATIRKQLGYTQADLAHALQVSTPTVSRLEDKAEVPREHVKVLLSLSPAAGAARGPYRQEKPSISRKPAAPPPRRAQAPALEQPKKEPTPPPAQGREVVHEADAIGAVLLEGKDLRRYWMRVVTLRQFLLARRRLMEARHSCQR